jgi:hypothetical protein
MEGKTYGQYYFQDVKRIVPANEGRNLIKISNKKIVVFKNE